ncbi:MAG: Flp pilus assembly complex ATPase component TadA [Thermoprotei archaeon]|nr:Flp pilus assembly complex ATPase component TadA [Thermoprotei archaeon]
MSYHFFGRVENQATQYVADYSALIKGAVSKAVNLGIVSAGATILIPSPILAALEKEANEGKAVGIAGLTELSKLKDLVGAGKIRIEVLHLPRQIIYEDPTSFSSMAREIALQRDYMLITGDKISADLASSIGVKVVFYTDKAQPVLRIEKFFDESTMSVHLVEDNFPMAKKGKPGSWTYERISEQPLSRLEMQSIFDEIIEATKSREDSFVEIDRKGSTIVQLGSYRIVIARPPFSSKWMITAVKPIIKLKLEDYNPPERLLERFRRKAEGILIAGAPGMGKTTFAQALAEFYLYEGKVVNTIESPRDMRLPPQIVQYSKNFAEKDELHDIMLLSRPDYTFFDELRGDEDFRLYVDLRLAGIGMVGVLHATTPIDAIQRFIGRVELGVIPSIVDTVIFIDKGEISKVYEISITVKLPTGLKEADLSRPVVEVKDFLTGELEYEIYTFGEQTVVVPIRRGKKGSEEQRLLRQLETLAPNAEVEINNGVAVLKIPPEEARLMSKRLKRIKRAVQKLGLDLRIETK